MGMLAVGTEDQLLEADDRIVVTLESALRAVVSLVGHAFLVSEFVDEDGVTTRFGFVDTGEFSVLRSDTDAKNIPVDPKYLERALECANRLGGWIVLDAHDEVVTDPVTSEQVKLRAIEQNRH